MKRSILPPFLFVLGCIIVIVGIVPSVMMIAGGQGEGGGISLINFLILGFILIGISEILSRLEAIHAALKDKSSLKD